MKPLTHKQILLTIVFGLVTTVALSLVWQYTQPLPIDYEGTHALSKAAVELQVTIYQEQGRQIRYEAEQLKGYVKGIEDVQRGHHGLASDAEGLCYSMLTQEQARQFLNALRELRRERP